MVKFRLRLKRDLVERARAVASMEGKSVEDFLVDLLRKLVEASEAEKLETRKTQSNRLDIQPVSRRSNAKLKIPHGLNSTP